MTGSHRPAFTNRNTHPLAMIAAVLGIVGLAVMIFTITAHKSPEQHQGAAIAVAVNATAAPPSSSAVESPASVTAAKPPPEPALTYVVKAGDNLTIIAAWFHLNGYGVLYDANKAVIGSDPSLIRPGQTITVSSNGMSIG